jgi:hypothetical protein
MDSINNSNTFFTPSLDQAKTLSQVMFGSFNKENNESSQPVIKKTTLPYCDGNDANQ